MRCTSLISLSNWGIVDFSVVPCVAPGMVADVMFTLGRIWILDSLVRNDFTERGGGAIVRLGKTEI